MRPPSVDALARSLTDVGLPHPLLVDVARRAVADGDPGSARDRAEKLARTLLRNVINATGVLLHTNLGRAPLVALGHHGYANLEIDLATGRRSSRDRHAADLIARACGAEAALVVNNCAAAVLLVLTALARDRGVVVSRGELVEIGGGFRVPDVMQQSGAHLLEVGTTNRTRLDDYRRALVRTGGVAVVLKVHQSNYRITGFTEEVGVAELGSLGPPVVFDIGSGLLDAATPWLSGSPPAWLAGEPAARQALEAGSALVTFSGDKLFGGPQAGVIAGLRDLVEACASHPLARAIRPGGLVLSALQDTALAYLRRDGNAIPFWRMATTPVEELSARAKTIGIGVTVECASVPGGGTLPERTIPSIGIALDGDYSDVLRANDPPVLARVHDSRTVLDLRTVSPSEDEVLAGALRACTS